MSIIDEWEIRTARVKNRHSSLRRLDAALRVLVKEGRGVGGYNVQKADRACADFFHFYVYGGNKDRNAVLEDCMYELQGELAKLSGKPKTLKGIKATGIKPVGYNLEICDQSKHNLYPVADFYRKPPLNSVEIQRLNEAFQRARRAVELARDALITIQRRRNFSPGMPQEEATYTDFFGAFNPSDPYDSHKLEWLTSAFRGLVLAFNKTPTVIDTRNMRLQGGYVTDDTIAMANRGHLLAFDSGGKNNKILALRKPVSVFVFRKFFEIDGYENVVYRTAGTLVHEFSHAVLSTADLPQVDDKGQFKCAFISMDESHPDYLSGSNPQLCCYTEPHCKQLAKLAPAYAAQNADNYSLFAMQLLRKKENW